MLLSLADIFRCPADHEETPLVLSVDAWHGQRVERGILGCPQCQSRYPIASGSIDFRTVRDSPIALVTDSGPNDEVDRVQALLNLADPGGVVLLAGRYAALAAALSRRLEITCLLIGARSESESCVGMMLDDRLPLTAGSLRAAAADAPAPALLPEMVRAIRGGGRLLIDRTPLPAGVHQLARDETSSLGEVLAPTQVIPLRRPARS
jgi:uncharacterized protein YbaR (Trm112 family)